MNGLKQLGIQQQDVQRCRLSSGCINCYAEKMTKRLQAMRLEKYQKGFEIALHTDTLDSPFRWKKPRLIFVNSMSVLFHEKIPLDYIKQVFLVMNSCKHYVFQVITKRAERLFDVHHELNWTSNIWMGVSVENQDCQYRVDLLQHINAQTKFLSIEPLLGSLPKSNLENIDWTIVGGESGSGARTIKKDWVVDIKEQCEISDTKFFFKQWGGVNIKKNGSLLDGKVYKEMPLYQEHSHSTLFS